jgi:hypothetical protein
MVDYSSFPADDGYTRTWAHDLPLLFFCGVWFEATFGLSSFLRKEREDARLFWPRFAKQKREKLSGLNPGPFKKKAKKVLFSLPFIISSQTQ